MNSTGVPPFSLSAIFHAPEPIHTPILPRCVGSGKLGLECQWGARWGRRFARGGGRTKAKAIGVECADGFVVVVIPTNDSISGDDEGKIEPEQRPKDKVILHNVRIKLGSIFGGKL